MRDKTYSVPGFRRKYTGVKIAGGVAGAVALVYFGSRVLKRLQLNGLSKRYGDIDEAVTGLGISLGTEYAQWDPRSWSEDENEAVKIVESHYENMAQINRKYLKRYKRSLPKDLQKNLSKEQWEQIKDLVLVTSDPHPRIPQRSNHSPAKSMTKAGKFSINK